MLTGRIPMWREADSQIDENGCSFKEFDSAMCCTPLGLEHAGMVPPRSKELPRRHLGYLV